MFRNPRVVLGSIASLFINAFVARTPSNLFRSYCYRVWLGKLGDESNVQMGCRFLNGRKIFIGENNVINFGTLMDGRRYAIRTGSNVSIGPQATILTLGHDPRSRIFADRGGDVTIGDYVWIGFDALILPDVEIGEGAVVGAGAVVTKSVEPYTIVAGNPAKAIGTRPRGLEYKLNFKALLG